ncbi:DUF2897 family protein [Shewanella sp. MF08487]|uniref:DUF2897 family protein n=1 Tax=Shewanella sp. MF08487 TaxID=3434873 RepID=UPI003D793FB1
MSTLEVWILIILILGVIASNLAALKYSAKFKLPQFGQHDKDKQIKTSDDDPDKTPSEADNDTSLQPTSATETSSEPNTKDRKE